MPSKQFEDKIRLMFNEARQAYGRGDFYQSFERLNITGQRPTGKRIQAYRLDEVLDKSQRVLDIGCNVGFLDLTIAPKVSFIDGLDTNSCLIRIAEEVRSHTGIKNCAFYNTRFEQFHTTKKYDLVLSFAVHLYMSIPFRAYIDKIASLSNPGCCLVIESHDPSKEDNDWADKVEYILSKGFVELRSGDIKDDGIIYRLFNVFRKKA